MDDLGWELDWGLSREEIEELIELSIEDVISAYETSLDAMVSSVAGITDPLGQLKDWFTDTINSIASWISDTITGTVRGFLDWLWSQIQGALSSVTGAITNLANIISSGFAELTSLLRTYVLDPLTEALNAAASFLSQLPDMIGSIAAKVSEAAGSALSAISSIVSSVGETLSKMASSVIASIRSAAEKALGAVSQLWAKIEAAGKALGEWVSSVGEWFSKVIEQVTAGLNAITNAITGVVTTITETVSGWVGTITDVFSKIKSALDEFLAMLTRAPEVIPDALINAATFIWENLMKPMFDWLHKNVIEPISGFVSSIAEKVSAGFEAISQAFTGFINAVLKFPEWFPRWFEEHIAKPIASALKGLAEWIWKSLPDWLREAIEAVRDALAEFAKDPLGTLQKAFAHLAEQIWALLPDWVKDTLTGIREALVGFAEAAQKLLEEFFRDPLGFIQKNVIAPLSEALSQFSKWIWENLPDWLKGAIETLKGWLEGAWKALQDFFRDPLGFIQRGFSWLADQIWKLLPDWLKGAIETVKKWFEDAWNALQEFFKDPLGFIQRGFQWLAEQIWKLLPDWLKEAIEGVKGFFEWLWEGLKGWLENVWDAIQEFIKDPLGFIMKRIAEPLFGALGWVWNMVSGGVQKILGLIAKWVSAAVSGVVGIAKSAVSEVMKIASGLLSPHSPSFADVARGIGNMFVAPVKWFFDQLSGPTEEYLSDKLKKIYGIEEGGGAGEMEVIIGMAAPLLPLYMGTLFVAKGFKSLAHALGNFRAEIEDYLEPFGVGLGLELAWLIVLPRVFYEIGEALEDLPQRFVEAFLIAFSLTAFEPMRYAFRLMWKQYLDGLGIENVPFEMPPLGEVRELARRFGLKETRDMVKALLLYRGYPTWFIENYTKLVEDASIEITDRFGAKRTIPLSLLYVQPSVSDLVRFMVRDIFGVGKKGLETFTQWAEKLGLYKDVAFLYYFFHFRYPSPERLWQFAARAMAGMLWYKPSEDEIKLATEHAKAVGIPEDKAKPAPPTALNFETFKVLNALSNYMKWHDYANFPWLPGFTTDNWIVIDTMADIPSKVDTRWMIKWGIFDYMAKKEIGIESGAPEFYKILDTKEVNKKVIMDLTMACRLLLATGLHPYYVPAVAVAEAVNAVAEERTLLRTGLLDIYRYGAANFSTIDSLMSNLVTASFKVAYLDMKEGKLKPAWVNIPIMFLPAERKLLELRALIDRYVRVWREMLTDLESGYREHILSGEDLKKYLNELASKINEYFGPAIEEVVGKEAAQKIKIELDEAYIESITKAWEPAREVYDVRRIRYWFYRVLGWIIYRLAFGYVRYEDVEDIVNAFSNYAKLSSKEVEAITGLAEKMINIAAREYIPTPSQLATIVEIVPKARAYIKRVFEARRVPKEWQPVWAVYINTKPLIDEIKKLVTVIEDLYEYFVIDAKTYGKFLEVLKDYGWEDAELKVMIDRGNVLRWRRAYRELVGTPRELVTFAEFVPKARRLALAEVKKRIDALPIGEEEKQFLYEMWEDYIRIKPVYDEVKKEITELISDYANGVITWDQFLTLLDELREWGIDEWEIDAYKFIAMMRRKRYEMRSS